MVEDMEGLTMIEYRLNCMVDRVVDLLQRDDAEESERESVDAFRRGLNTALGDGEDADFRLAPWIEEAVVWRILTFRLLRGLAPVDLVVNKGKGMAAGTYVVQPAVDGVAKAYERWRAVMGEVLERSGADRGHTGGFPSMMQPILEKTEGFVEEVLEAAGRLEISEDAEPE